MSRVFLGLVIGTCVAMDANFARAGGADKLDISGGWNFEVEIGGSAGTPVFVFEQEGEKLTGQYRGQFGEAEVTGTLKGDAIEFSFGPEGQKVVYKGTAKKDAMEGEADYAGQAAGAWKATRIDLTGTWKIEIEVGGNSGTPVFTLKQEGDKLTGGYSGQFGEADVTGKVTGDKVEFSFERDGQKIVYTGKVTRDTMEGEADYAGQATGTWTGKREAKDK